MARKMSEVPVGERWMEECTVYFDDVRTLEGFIWQCREWHVFCEKCYEQLGSDGAPL